MQKRGQVTIFIILGIVILSSVGFVYLVKNEYFKSEFEKQRDKAIVPEQLAPVSMFLDSCIESLTKDGANLVGINGGYYNGLPEDILPRSVVNPFSNSLEVVGGLEVPFWYYVSANNLQMNQVPSLENIESEIGDYLSENFYEYCIVELSRFVEQGYGIDIELGGEVDVNIEDTHIEVIYDHVIQVSLNNVTSVLETHFADVDVNLGNLYNSAIAIIEKENDEYFLEEKTIDIMSVFDSIPYSETELTCEELSWPKQEVVSNFKNIVSDNIRGLNIEGTNFEQNADLYDYFVLDTKKIKNLDSATFSYSTNWPFVIDVAPEKNGFLVADDITNGIAGELGDFLYGIMCLNTYNFVYDVKYPVLITLIDNEGYIFQFATMVVIDNNQPRKNTADIIDYGSDGELGDTYCSNLVIDSEVIVLDAETMSEVQGAEIFFKCFSTECRLGNTDFSGSLSSKFPQCMNGLISASKEGYYKGSEVMSTNVETQTTVFVQPKYDLDYITKVIDGSSIRDLSEDEQVIFMFDNLNNNFVVNAEGNSGEIELIAGTYLVKSYLSTGEDYTIELKGDTLSKCIEVPRPSMLGLFFKKEECFEFELEDIELDETIIGGVEFEFIINNYEVANADTITLYSVFDRIPTKHEDLSQIFENIKHNHLEDSFRYPIFE
ncbi:hypothetical protein HOD61_03320 [archaeon]|jgi:hypothetical protein|nr:hypothetical protein [archaeon]